MLLLEKICLLLHSYSFHILLSWRVDRCIDIRIQQQILYVSNLIVNLRKVCLIVITLADYRLQITLTEVADDNLVGEGLRVVTVLG